MNEMSLMQNKFGGGWLANFKIEQANQVNKLLKGIKIKWSKLQSYTFFILLYLLQLLCNVIDEVL